MIVPNEIYYVNHIIEGRIDIKRGTILALFISPDNDEDYNAEPLRVNLENTFETKEQALDFVKKWYGDILQMKIKQIEGL